MNIGLQTSLKLSQTLSPQMIQSLKLLQYSSLQLEQVIRKEIQENPILEETVEETNNENEKREEVDQQAEDKSDTQEATEEIDWDAYFDETSRETTFSGDREERTTELYEKINVSSASLEEHLLDQLHEKKFSEEAMNIGEYIIGNINDRGYLAIPPLEISEKFNVSEKEVNEIRFTIQHFDPRGIGSTTLQECLLIQLYFKGLSDSLAAKILEEHFTLLTKYNLPAIAKKMNIPASDIQIAVNEIGKLDPNPGMSVSSTKPQVITPELIVSKLDNGEFSITLADGSVPNIQVSKPYLSMLRGEKNKTPEIKKYISEKLNSANWLIRSIEQRKVTMIKVMTAIVDMQKKWFNEGPPHIKPLILQKVADEIEMHISTVCRVTNDKYVQTPYGVFELKHFFGSGVDQGDGTEVSTSRAKDMLKEIVDNEDKKKPLSDQKLVDMLKTKNIAVARRTISKYREQLNILPARLRKEF